MGEVAGRPEIQDDHVGTQLQLEAGAAGVADQEPARRLLGVTEDRFCALLATLGVPVDRLLAPIKRPTRRRFTDVVHHGH